MSFPISTGIGGYAGWKILQRIEDRQMERLSNDRLVQRNLSYFRDRIEIISSAEELVGDYKMLTIALGAFGLEGEINNRALIRKVLESDLSDKKSLANRFADKRFLKLAEAFNFHDRSKSSEKVDESFDIRAGLSLLDEKNEHIREDAHKAHDALKKLAEKYNEEIEWLRDRGWSEKDINKYSSSLDHSLWKKALDPKGDPSATHVVKVIKGAFGFSDDFDKLEPYQKLKKVSEASKALFSNLDAPELYKNSEENNNAGELLSEPLSFKSIGQPENLARLAWAFAFNTQKTPHNTYAPKVTEGVKTAAVEPSGPLTEAERLAQEKALAYEQKFQNDSFLRRVGLNISADDEKSLSAEDKNYLEREKAFALSARDKLIELARSDNNDDQFWSEVLNDPTLDKIFRDVFPLRLFPLKGSFDELFSFVKTDALNKMAEVMLSASAFRDFSNPEVYERLISTYAANRRNEAERQEFHTSQLNAADYDAWLNQGGWLEGQELILRAGLGTATDLAVEFPSKELGALEKSRQFPNELRDKLDVLAKSGKADDELWLDALKDAALEGMIKSVFKLESYFDTLSPKNKVEKLNISLTEVLGVSLFSSFSDPLINKRFVENYIYSQRKADQFVQHVGLGFLEEKEQDLPLNIRKNIIKVAESQKDDDDQWLDAVKDPDLGKAIKSVFSLDGDFDSLPDFVKLERLKIASRRTFGVDSFNSFAQPQTHEPFIATFIFNERNFSLPSDKSSATPNLAERVADAYLGREFERRVGLGDQNMRLALNARRELATFADGADDADDDKNTDEATKNRALWYEVLGNPPLRKVFEGAFGFSENYARIDVDRQVLEFSKASERILGTSSFEEIARPENIEKLLRNFLIRSDTATGPSANRYSAALAIMSQSNRFG